ncbi:MAG: hypothetical protein ABIQ02_14540 [Saprospiraceae bacterium]
MKKTIVSLVIIAAIVVTVSTGANAQASTSNLVNITSLKTKSPDKGSPGARDSLIAIYNSKVIDKNTYILSHREYTHYFTASNSDYLVVEEYKDMAGMEASFEMNTELEKKAWPDAMKRKEFMDAMGAYFETWHGDALYHMNPKLSKN